MTKRQYIDALFKTYRLVSVLADKNECRTLRVRHKEKQVDMIVHELLKPIAAYDLLCGIRCTQLPEVYDAITLEDGQIVLEEYIDGMTVDEVMQSGRYHPRGARRVLLEVCHALTVLHERDIIHRDVKPENVMVTASGRVVLVDFNASRRVSVGARDTVIMGTVGYASPEQLGLSQSDARTDIYAAGVLLNVMATGRHPTEELARGKLGRVVRKCTAVNPSERYQTAEELARGL